MEIISDSIILEKAQFLYKNCKDATIKDFAWMVCHGYGQLGDKFLTQFTELDSNIHLVVAPEASHRFYWGNQSQIPAASWMTKRYRLEEIKENNTYLNAVYQKHIMPSPKKILLGFSQGGTIMWRYILDKMPDFDLFINYAGWVPDELDLSLYHDYLSDKKLIFTSGKNDRYLPEERMAVLKKLFQNWRIRVEYESTMDGHKVNPKHIKNLFEKYLT